MNTRVIAPFFLSALLSGTALAGDVITSEANQFLGTKRFLETTRSSQSAVVAPSVSLGSISPSVVFRGAQFGSSGVGLRNRAGGAINISGVNTPVKGAYLYWAVLTNGAAPPSTKVINIQRTAPTMGTSVAVTGTVIGTGAAPCWTSCAKTWRTSST